MEFGLELGSLKIHDQSFNCQQNSARFFKLIVEIRGL